MTLDASGFGMGARSQRYAMIVNDGKVQELLVEPGPGLNVSSAESVLEKALRSLHAAAASADAVARACVPPVTSARVST